MDKVLQCYLQLNLGLITVNCQKVHVPIFPEILRIYETTEQSVIALAPPYNLSVSLFENINLICETIGNPRPSVTWIKNEVTVTHDETLVFSSFDAANRGFYKCMSSNHLGFASSDEIVLNIIGQSNTYSAHTSNE